MRLRRDTVLRRAPELTLRLTPNGGAEVFVPGGDRVEAGKRALRVLDAFERPTTIADALAGLQAAGSGDWVEVTGILIRLHQAGILLSPDRVGDAVAGVRESFAAAPIHVRMLEDRGRTEAYLAAISASVRPGDVVVDLGAGTGILSLGAARAGAARVYAIEATAIGSLAERVFRANGVADRVKLLSGWSSAVQLEELADVLVTETIGDDPLGEEILESVVDARARLLRPGATVIPRRLRILGRPVEVPADVVGPQAFAPTLVEAWRDRYGFDFGVLAAGVPAWPRFVRLSARRAQSCRPLTPPALLADLDLSTIESWAVSGDARASVEADGRADALLVWFEAELAPGTVISSDPRTASSDTSWGCALWVQPAHVPVRSGEEVAFGLRYRTGAVDGGWVGRPPD